MSNPALQSMLNYSGAIAIVIFGLWLFSDHDSLSFSTIQGADTDVISPVQHARFVAGENFNNRYPPVEESDNQHRVSMPDLERSTAYVDTFDGESRGLPDSSGVISSQQSRVITDVNAAADEEVASDNDWFAGIMSKARTLGDNIIHINIDGAAASSTTADRNNSASNQGAEPVNNESMLPQPSEEETLTDNNQVDCPSMMYMGGNAYGRNMLVKMGCSIPP